MHSNPILDLAGGEAALPAVLARAHVGHARLIGAVDVEHGGPMASLIAAVSGLPPAGRNIPFSVSGDHWPDGVRWLRNFDGVRIDSGFEREGELLLERHWPFTFRFRLVVENARLSYRLQSVEFCSIALPLWMAPTIEAAEWDEEGRYGFSVEIGLPWLGRLVRYSGTLDP